jgi:hypothetical protein
MNTNTVISYPIPAYQNVPIMAQYFKPSQFIISNVILGSQTIVQTTENTNYVIGQEIRLIIPPSFGCRQLNNQTGYVISINANQVTTTIDSSVNVSPYISSSATTPAQILAIGDINTGNISFNPPKIPPHIPGSFRNISPE